MKDHKDSVKNALMNYHRKQMPQGNMRKTRGKNKKPEKDVEKAVLMWGKDLNLALHVVEASSYDPILRRKGMSRATSGFPDVVGNTPDGHSVWIELKAKDRRSTLSLAQRVFLEAKIDQNCFAVVVDSVERLAQYWKGFWSLKSKDERQSFLRDCLPKPRKEHNQEVDTEMGF